MKKEYSAPEIEKFVFSFDDILGDFNVSFNEHGSSDHNDDDVEGDW